VSCCCFSRGWFTERRAGSRAHWSPNPTAVFRTHMRSSQNGQRADPAASRRRSPEGHADPRQSAQGQRQKALLQPEVPAQSQQLRRDQHRPVTTQGAGSSSVAPVSAGSENLFRELNSRPASNTRNAAAHGGDVNLAVAAVTKVNFRSAASASSRGPVGSGASASTRSWGVSAPCFEVMSPGAPWETGFAERESREAGPEPQHRTGCLTELRRQMR
jgi:hypothetical protein